LKETWIWECLNKGTSKVERLEFGYGEIPNTLEFQWEGQTYRRGPLVDIIHDKKPGLVEGLPEIAVQRNIDGAVGWQYDQWDPAFKKFDENPNSPSYGQPVFGSRDDVRRGLRNLNERGCSAEYGEGLSAIKP